MISINIPLGLSWLWALLVSLFAVPSIIYIAHLKNMLDTPNGRTVHQSLTPRLGGVAVFAGFMSALTIFAPLQNGAKELLAGCIILFFVGLKDDLVGMSVSKKFVGQLLATGIVMIMADVRITSFQGILGIGMLPVGISYAFTLAVIVGITNAINLIDGLDGLAGTIVLIISGTFGYYFYVYGGASYGNYAYVAVCLIGGLIGFLRYNFHRAPIFMGDTGSLVCGFIVSVMAIQFIEMGLRVEQPFGSSAPSVAVGILFVPLFDTLRVFSLRMLAGRSPFSPDKNHIHHRILAMGFSQISTVLLLGLLNLLVTLLVIRFAAVGNTVLIAALAAFSALLSIFFGVYQSRISRRQLLAAEGDNEPVPSHATSRLIAHVVVPHLEPSVGNDSRFAPRCPGQRVPSVTAGLAHGAFRRLAHSRRGSQPPHLLPARLSSAGSCLLPVGARRT